MEPASAIGVASAAITFLDFSIDVCKTFSQIITSDEGITKHNADVEATVKRHKERTEALKTKSASATSLQLGPDISRAVDESITDSAELLALIERLRQAKDFPVIGPLKAVYRSMRSRERIEKLQRKAETSQSVITQGLIRATWETDALHHESSAKAFQNLDKQATDLLEALRAGDSAYLKKLIESRRHFDTTVSDLQDSIRAGNDKITQKIDNLIQRVVDMDKPDLKKAFVDSLFFPDYERREKALSGPSPKTFEWIFDRDGVAGSTPSRWVSWPSFPQWLEDADSSQQYWLSGKAGSGKSTLMAHIIRDDMALKRTGGHLKKWHGTKTLHVLKFFLFRPGREQQAGLEFLLRSLLYQLVTAIPVLQEILMANFLSLNRGARIPTWPVETLKSMLQSALDAADDRCFLIFIDGADEFEDFQHLGGRSVHATELVDILFEIQQPKHIKLCISSRPELRINIAHQSFMEAKLADLNLDDIHHFAEQQMQAMAAIPNSKDRSNLAEEISDRADGIFLWAAFAVTQMKNACRDGYGEDCFELRKRLDDMGKDLNDAISHMLQGIERSHRPVLAFYLQVLKSWQDCDGLEPLPLALIALTRSGEDTQTRSEFLAACRKERRDIPIFSQGILEISDSLVDDFFELPEERFTLVRSRSDRSSENDLELQCEQLNFEPGEGAWTTVAFSDYYGEINKFRRAYVSFIHRSAYDFFFSPDDWNDEHVKQCRSLLDHNGESGVHAKVRAGLEKLFWIMPSLNFKKTPGKGLLVQQIVWYLNMIITYTVHTAGSSLNQSYLTRYLDDLLSSMRLELLLHLVKAPIAESRKHVPGDIFSPQLHNGCLRTLDEDRLSIFEATGLPADLKTMARLEGHFLYTCASWETLHDYVKNRLDILNERAIAPLVQAALLAELARGAKQPFRPEAQTAGVFLQNFIQRWFHSLARTHRSLESHKSVWQRIAWIASGCVDSSVRESPKEIRLNSVRNTWLEGVLYQWTPLVSGGNTGGHEEAMIQALVSYCTMFINLPGLPEGPRVLDLSARALEPWDVWIGVPPELTVCRVVPTSLFICMGSLSTADTEIRKGNPSNLQGGRYRLSRIAETWAIPKLLFSVDIDPQTELWDGLGLVAREDVRDFLEMKNLEQRKVDVLVDAVRHSIKLDEDQKDCMIKDIRDFEVYDPQT